MQYEVSCLLISVSRMDDSFTDIASLLFIDPTIYMILQNLAFHQPVRYSRAAVHISGSSSFMQYYGEASQAKAYQVPPFARLGLLNCSAWCSL